MGCGGSARSLLAIGFPRKVISRPQPDYNRFFFADNININLSYFLIQNCSLFVTYSSIISRLLFLRFNSFGLTEAIGTLLAFGYGLFQVKSSGANNFKIINKVKYFENSYNILTNLLIWRADILLPTCFGSPDPNLDLIACDNLLCFHAALPSFVLSEKFGMEHSRFAELRDPQNR